MCRLPTDGLWMQKLNAWEQGGSLFQHRIRYLHLTLARTGGGVGATPPPLRFFADSKKTAARSAAGFWATLWGKPCAIFGKKKFDRVRSGHGAMTSSEEQPPATLATKSCFLATWLGAIDANDNIWTLLGQDIDRLEFAHCRLGHRGHLRSVT